MTVALIGLQRAALTPGWSRSRYARRTRVPELRANLQARRVDLRRIRATRGSEDAIATVAGNIERLRRQIGDLIAAHEALEQRRDAALRALPDLLGRTPTTGGSDAIAEAERVLREERH